MICGIYRTKIAPEASLGSRDLPVVRLEDGCLGPRLVEFVPSKPLQNSTLSIKLVCRTGGFWGSCFLRSGCVGNIRSDDYMPLSVRIEGKSQEHVIYLDVNGAANQLLVSKEEIRAAQNKPGYWGDRIVTLHTCITVIQREVTGFRSERDVYRKMLVIHSLALEALQEKGAPRGIACKIQEATILQNQTGQLEVLYSLGELGEGSAGSVYKIISFASGKLSALKSYHFDKAAIVRNSVTESVMTYQSSHSESSSSLMAVNRIIERNDGYFDEEYELCSSRILDEYRRYDEVKFKNLCKDVVSALEEFREVGYAYLDVKPGNVLETKDIEGRGAFKLGDFDSSSPYIKNVEGFKKWLQSPSHSIIHTKSMNIERDIYCLRCLRDLGSDVLCLEQEAHCDDFEPNIEGLVQLLGNKKISNFLGSRASEELIRCLERLNFEDFYDSLLSIFAKRAEQTAVFQLGVMLYVGLGGRFPYQLACHREEYLEFMPESYGDIQSRITSLKRVKDADFKNLIISMLNPDSELRPSLSEVSCFLA